MRVGIPKETWPGETRVAVIPAAVGGLVKSGLEVAVESGAGTAAGFPDDGYRSQGATLVSRPELFKTSDIVLQVRATPADPSPIPWAARRRSGSWLRSASTCFRWN
jgi:proton-translocating NAD(P)+ transhydrogenase subunit alpha